MLDRITHISGEKSRGRISAERDVRLDDWFFHCHVLYHMKAGMSRIFHYEGSEPDADLLPERRALFRDPIYAWANASVMSHFTEGIVTASTTRHELAAEWEIGWQNIDDDLDQLDEPGEWK